jgi:Ca2+-transporting ATPase
MNIDWHLLSLSEVSEKLDTSPQVLMKTANQRQSQYGKNKIKYKKRTLFADDPSSIVNFMILILIVVAIVSRFLGGITAVIILIIVLSTP